MAENAVAVMITVWCTATEEGATYMLVELPAEFTGFPAPSEPTAVGEILQVTARLSAPLAFTSAVSVADWP